MVNKKKTKYLSDLIRFKKFHKDEFNWQESEFLREVRSHPEINLECFTNKKITRVEQEYWFYNEYIKQSNREIFIGYDVERKEMICYVDIYSDSVMHKRKSFDFFVDPKIVNRHIYIEPTLRWCIHKASQNELETHRFQIFVESSLDHKIELLNKFGFEIDGLIRDFAFDGNKWKNYYLMSLIIT